MELRVKEATKLNKWFLNKPTRLGLSAKLLILTILFVMLAEILIFVPSIANFRKNWLEERLAAAQIAALSVEASPDKELPRMLQKELLKNAQVYMVALHRADARRLVLSPESGTDTVKFTTTYDLRNPSSWALVRDTALLMLNPNPGLVRVLGKPVFGAGDMIDIVVNEAACREAAMYFGLKILGLSIIISIITATLVYLALNALLVSPMMRITSNMVHYGDNPEDQTRIISPSSRQDEIGIAESELNKMQTELSAMLQQKSRLASLGLAVSKINHDLRNMLANATLISDRMSMIKDEQVQKFTPKLITSLDRAIRLCQNTLKYGQAPEPIPERSKFLLDELADEVGESLGLTTHKSINWQTEIDKDIELFADRDQIYRVLLNLCRNAKEVLEADTSNSEHQISIKSKLNGSHTLIEVSDDGPGVPEQAKQHLFDAFKGSVRQGGSGLGLAISAELIRAHGGQLELLDTQKGAVFRITLNGHEAEKS